MEYPIKAGLFSLLTGPFIVLSGDSSKLKRPFSLKDRRKVMVVLSSESWNWEPIRKEDRMRRTSIYIGAVISLLILLLFSTVNAQTGDKLRGIRPSGNVNTPHKVFIVFKAIPGEDDEDFVKGLGGTVKYAYRIVPAIAAEIPEAAIEGLQRNPNVIAIEAVGKVKAIEDSYPWGISRIGSHIVHSNLLNKGYGVRVAIIDSGIDYNHPDLANNYGGGWDFAYDDDDPYDGHSHGTHVAGIVAADDNGSGIIGVAPDVELFALKVLDDSGSGWDYDVVAALDWIAGYNNENSSAPIRITNNSYAGSDLNNTTVQAAFDNLASAGVLHVAAAGNSGTWFGRGDNVGYPARFASVVAVAATDSSDRRAYFSSTGPAVELSAPGVNIESTVPGGGTALKSGTSMASPHVAGVAALVMATGMTDPTTVRDRLKATADDLGATGKDDQYGWGLVDADEAADLGPLLNIPPTAGFSYIISGLVVDFKDESSDSDGSIFGWNWSFGDGSTSMAQNPTHTYAAGGAYIVTLSVTDDGGATDSFSDDVTVSNDSNKAPTASFTVTTSELTATFTDTSTDSDGSVVSWNWDFGDGSTSTVQNPTRTYAAGGAYTVTLSVTDDDGATGSVSQM
jgi:subtilisin family serine protease